MENKVTGLEYLIKRLGVDEDNSNTEDVEKAEYYNTYKTIVSYIISLPPKQYTLLSSMIGILLVENLDAKEQISLGKFINNIGQTIITSATQEQLSIKREKYKK